MKVHIVSKHPTEDRILGRLARTLASSTGWTHSDECRPDVDLNYVVPYIYVAERWLDWNLTPLAAYFSHLEPNNPGKRRMWDHAAEKVALRVCTAKMYVDLLTETGRRPTVLARPPIDPQFAFQSLAHGRRTTLGLVPDRDPTVGLAGWVYRDNRKGEALISKLFGQDIATRIQFAATGGGWPAPIQSTEIPWTQMPDFYGSLDAYLCTSLIEGVPMPPLEALATGCPVVIPRGVGMLDDLQETPGAVYHYNAGDIGQLVAALHTAITKHPADQTAFEYLVRPYTPAAWAFDHDHAFIEHITTRAQRRTISKPAIKKRPEPPPSPTSKPSPAPVTKLTRAELAAAAGEAITPLTELTTSSEPTNNDWRTHAGVYIVAYGDPARECAKRLIRSWDKHMTGIPVCLASDRALDIELLTTRIQWVIEPEVDIGARSAKTRIYDLAPRSWEYVMYLDADTELVNSVEYLYDALAHGWEWLICKNPQRFHIARHMERPDNKDECRETFQLWGSDEMMQWNGGVFAFRRCTNTEAFFRAWHREWQVYGKRDQGALLRALWQHPLRSLWLGNEWNTVVRYVPPDRTAGILHHVEEARRWTGRIEERSDSPQAWQRVEQHLATTKQRSH